MFLKNKRKSIEISIFSVLTSNIIVVKYNIYDNNSHTMSKSFIGGRIMPRSKIFTKVLAAFLVFTLTFSNFALVGEAFASSIFDGLFGAGETTGHSNVVFEAYVGEDKTNSVTANVNDENLAISLDLNVKDSGYLKDGKIAITTTEEEKDLNFRLKGEFEETETIQTVQDNIISLKQIDFGTDVTLNVPIEYQNEEYVNESKVSSESKVVFTGVYVDKDGKETELSKEVPLSISWKDEREVKLSEEVSKYIAFEMGNNKGLILQTVVNVDSSSEKNTLPVSNSKVDIGVPSIEGKDPSSIKVVASSTAGTNGKSDEKVEFGEGNWSYNSDQKTLTISVQNNKELVKVSNAGENDNLVDGEEELREEERYYAKSGVDTYVVTYTYENIDIPNEVNISSNVKAEVATLNGVASNEQTYEFNLVGETGDIVSYSINNETESMSKAYTYVNYNSADKYEVNYDSKTIVNISYKDIVEGITVQDVDSFYTTANGNSYVADDVYYKQISINKENFINILGDKGTVTVKDNNGNVFAVIDNETETNEFGDFVISFEGKVSKLVFETTKPVQEGNLIISNKKASTNSMYSRDEYKEFDRLVSRVQVLVKYSYVENLVDLGTKEISTELKNTTTKANLVLDRDSLSTLATNNNVELRIELGNDKDTSDVYSHSVFDISMPSYVQDVEILDSSIMYGEGLYISNIEKIDNIIRVTVDGTQNALSSGVLNNGTNIVLNTNITVDLFTPAVKGAIMLNYSNDSATAYSENGEYTLPIDYSAPTGLVAVNTTTGYDEVGSVLTSVRQGNQVAEIAKNSEAKVANMEVIVMNNNNNIVSDLSILGRIPFDGVKDIQTGEELGTNVNTKLVSSIIPDEKNGSEFKVYYSENSEATKDLSDSSNKWTEEFNENTKSYLIVPVDQNYEMQVAEVLRFTYNYEIPADLKLNQEVAGTFMAYYKNHTEVATVDEQSKADEIALSTGEGPELGLKLVSSSSTAVKEYEEIIYKIEVKNTGKTSAKNVVVNFPVAEGMSVTETLAEDGITSNVLDNGIQFMIPEIGIESSKEVTIKVKTALVGDEENATIEAKATATAEDLETSVTSDTITTKVEKTNLAIELSNNFDLDYESKVLPETEVQYNIAVRNLSDKDISNAVIKMKLPDEVSYKNAYLMEDSGEIRLAKNEAVASYDEGSRTVTIKAGNLKSYTTAQAQVVIVAKDLPLGTTMQESVAKASVMADGYDEIESNQNSLVIIKSSLVINQTTNTTSTYVTEGDGIEYVFKVKNEGSAPAYEVRLTDYIPEGLVAKSVAYDVNGATVNKKVTGNKAPVITTPSIEPNGEFDVTVKALANSLNGMQEMTVTNTGSVISKSMTEAIQSNEITHIVEADVNKANNSNEDAVENTGATSNSTANSNITKTYKITGTAWLDENEDGMRNETEQKMSNITARLVNSDTGVIVKSVTTDSKGDYTFAGISNGNYLIVFDYDTVKYTVTTYQKAGVEPNLNSDAITTKVEQDGKQRNAAVTDTINLTDSSISGVDIGFVYADTFDLSLEKSITKITVQNKAGTNSVSFDNVNLAQMPIAAKHLSSSVAYIEYNFKVSNKGEIAGFAKRIVDYIPQGITFSSTLNKDWYTGTDGNLYTNSLADIELKPGETKEIKLVLTKQMTEENTGLVNNLAEIAEDYNIYGVSDTNSTPLNKAQGENDLGSADAILTVKTGEVFIYVSVIITSIMLGATIIFIAYTQIIVKRRKAGV